MNSVNNKRKPIHSLLKEIGGVFVNLLLGNISGKLELSMLLLILAMVCFLAPIVGLKGGLIVKPYSFYLFGGFLTLISIYLIFRRWKEIKEESNQ